MRVLPLTRTYAQQTNPERHSHPRNGDRPNDRVDIPRAATGPRASCSATRSHHGSRLHIHWRRLTEAQVNTKRTILNIDLLNQRHELLLTLYRLRALPVLLQRCQGLLKQFAADLLRRGLAEGRLLLGEQFPVLHFCLIMFLVSFDELHASDV